MKSQHGFTLLEVLVAITITAVIGVGVWQVLNGVIQSRDRVDELADSFDGLQRAMLLMERDMTQIVNRPARDIYGDFKPAFTSREDDLALMLTRQGWRNPLGIRRSGLQRVGWEYTGSELRRRYWPVLDQGQEDESQEILLLEGVTAFDLRFMNDQNGWEPDWPSDESLAALNPGSRPDISLPRAVEITLEHERFGELVRTFVLPDFDPAKAQGFLNQWNKDRNKAEEEEEVSVSGQGG
ncbi:type II secretion system minor pseudopilin GspJ [Marinobacter salexigens]|uniref:type II secretion system minor pseudopilin GspJ n=1 Tax=Marinobacter salexigens TaxID=1925763 RepID=UPI000C2834E2|nr:type II secretion system minor pseudopilin GspJ [Marinobacter salexigens]